MVLTKVAKGVGLPIHIPRIEKLKRSLCTLDEFIQEPAVSRRDLSGLIFAFVATFEHAWKCLEDRVSDLGYSTRKIQPILDAVVKAGLISAAEKEIWMQMLEDKNLAWHVYSDSISKELAKRIRETHFVALGSVHERLRG